MRKNHGQFPPVAKADVENAFTGVNATALGFGLNEEALTFNLAVGLPGLSF